MTQVNQQDDGQQQLILQGMGQLLDLAHRARHAKDLQELCFQLVNDTHQLAPYRQAALWLVSGGIHTLSGVVQIEANAPYTHWLNRVCHQLNLKTGARLVSVADVGPAEAEEWPEWLPPHGLWLPIYGEKGQNIGALLLARDPAWLAHEQALLQEWVDIWSHASWAKQIAEAGPLRRWWQTRQGKGKRRWHHPYTYAALALIAIACLPIRLSVLAPGELVPAHPAVVRSPMEGVIEKILVQPNQMVSTGQPLFRFDETDLNSRLEMSRQNLATAEAEYRQSAQLAVTDNKFNSQLAGLLGKIEQSKAENQYWQAMLERSRVLAPQAGIALIGDANEWSGKPVVTGERILRIATPGDVEIEAWLGVGDTIPLRSNAATTLYLNADPLHPLRAQLRYIAHEAIQRPDGSYAYRVRASLKQSTQQRVGLKGTLNLEGERVPLIYWICRRPLAALRQSLGS